MFALAALNKAAQASWMDIDAIEQMPKAERLRREAEFSKRRGFLIFSTKVYDK